MCVLSMVSIHLEFFCLLNKHPTENTIRHKDILETTQVDGYSSQRLAHVAAFGPVNLTLEDLQKRRKN